LLQPLCRRCGRATVPRNNVMAANASATTDDPARNNGEDTTCGFDCGGLVSFLAAGAVLSASLIIGSSVSMVFADANDLVGAILEGFLELGL
jgi:hypothetical protein